MEQREGAARAAARDAGATDRFGARDSGFHAAVAEAFRAIAAHEPDRVRIVDAAGPVDQVTARLLAALSDLLP